MTVHIALLRGINVGGNKMVAMADLRALVASLGFSDVRTLLQSGNVVFRSQGKAAARLETLLETEVEKRFGLETSFIVRTAAEWDDAIAKNPFPAEAESDPARLVVMFLKAAPDAAAVKALQAAIKGRETVRADGRQAYLVYPDGQGSSKLTINVIEKHLGSRGTARNWNTVRKLAALGSET